MDNAYQIIEDLLQKFKPQLGDDYAKYRNHVYRVFFNCLLFDDSMANREKYAIAAVYHDIGIWTHLSIDYLDPSVAQVRIYLNETGRMEWTDEIILMINWHHKITAYYGKHEKITENFRKADWIDVSLGVLNFGANKPVIKLNRKKNPTLGFHAFLLKKIIKNFFAHPLNPLPMFRK